LDEAPPIPSRAVLFLFASPGIDRYRDENNTHAMTPKRWSFVQSLQEDLLAISRYVEFHEANRKTFSLAFDKIILAAGSEINSIFEELVHGEKGNLNIDKAKGHLLPQMPSITSTEARLVASEYPVLKPWENWGTANPEWWSMGYNKLKHERSKHYRDATLEYALLSVSGLLILTLHAHRLTTGHDAAVDAFAGRQIFEISNPAIASDGYQGGSIEHTFDIGPRP
jgi:hypothetical protein